MRLRSRLVIVILVASLPPLTILGYGAINTATEEVSRHVKQRQGDKGQSMAVLADTWMDLQLRSLVEQVSLFDLRDLEDEKLAGFLKLVFRQVPEVHIASIINREGIDLSPSLYLVEPGQGELAGKEGITEARFLEFREGFPDPDTARSVRPGVWLGRPYTPADREGPVVPVLVEARDGDALLAVELALDGFTQPLGARSSLNEDVALLDSELRPFLNGEAGLVDVGALEFFLQSRVTAEVEYTTAGGVEVLAACAPIESTGWFVVVAVTGESTKAAGRKITQETVFWAFLAAVLSVVLGMMYARDLSVPVVRLKNAVVAVSRGDFGRRLSAAGGDELVSLTRAFNLMSTSLERNRQEIRTKNEKIEAYTREIEAYNRQLEGMVEERTRELREAQEKLVQSARLAAVGEMGAGLAHELNNPLTGILGMTQVVRARLQAAPESEMLETVEELAQRCSQIVSDLLHFYREGPGDAAVDPAERDVVDLESVIHDVLARVGQPFRQRGITIEHRVRGGLRTRGDRIQLERALTQLLTSLRTATGDGGHVALDGFTGGQEVEIRITISGHDVSVGTDDWMASGMGFWGARIVLDDHGGRLVEPAEAERGAGGALCWRVLLPVVTS